MKKTVCSLMLCAVLFSSCATIVGDKTQLMPISSTPSDASISITDEKGKEIFAGKTPTSVTLQKSDGSYFGGKCFIVKISKEGYETQNITISAHANGWYIAGNLVFGGLIGWFIVDPLTGAMYTLSPEQISPQLDAKAAMNNTNNNEKLSIVLVQDVPESLRREMKKIN